MLAMSDVLKPFVVETNASRMGLGAILMHDNHPMSFFSRVLGPRVQQKPIYESELIAIVLAVLRWKDYLIGAYFVLKSSCWNKGKLELHIRNG